MNKLNYDLLTENKEYENNSETITQEFITDLADSIMVSRKIITEHNQDVKLTMAQFDYIKSMYSKLQDMNIDLNTILEELELK